MKKTIYSLAALAGLTLAGAAQAYPVKLVKYVQLSGTTESVLRWDGGAGCTNYAIKTNCINPANTVMSSRGIVPSTATWDWNPTTGVLSSVGDFNSASTIGSNSMSPMVLGDRVTNLTLNTATSTTSATVYACAEGTFLASVGANGCLNTDLGANFTDDSTVVYNVGGDPTCVKLTIGGDDTAMEGAPRGLITRSGNGTTCDATDGAFNIWTVVSDNTGTGGQLTIASSGDITTPDGAYFIFDTLPHAVDDTTDAIPTVAKQIDVLANDVALADPVTVAINTAPAKGTATVVGSPGNAASVHITYTGNSGATGTDTFTYDVTTGSTTSTATVTVTLLDVGANNDTGATTRNKPVAINVGGNDTGFTADVTVSQVGSCDNGGSFAPGAAGPVASASVTYTPVSAAGSAGYTEICTYQITDGSLTDTATITVTVSNTVPAATAGSITISTTGADPSTKSGTFNAASGGNILGNAPATVTVTDPAKGSASVSGTTVTYTPDATFFAGTDTFDYTITDADGETATATVTVTIADATPALAAITGLTTTAGTATPPRALNVTLGNGSLAQHTFTVTTQGAGGSCAVNSAGTAVTYTPNAGFTGADSCVITVADGNGTTATGNVGVVVNAAQGGGGGGGASNVLPGGNGALDIWSLALLGSAGVWIRRKRKAA